MRAEAVAARSRRQISPVLQQVRRSVRREAAVSTAFLTWPNAARTIPTALPEARPCHAAAGDYRDMPFISRRMSSRSCSRVTSPGGT